MALILKRPNSDTIILKRSFIARLSSLIWFGAAGGLMFTLKEDDRIWIAVPCLLIGMHLFTYIVRINIRLPQRDILRRQRILLLFGHEQLLPFSGIRSVRIGTRGKFLKIWHLYFFLVDTSRLSITHSFLLNRIEVQGSELARVVGKPLVYEQEEREPDKRNEPE